MARESGKTVRLFRFSGSSGLSGFSGFVKVALALLAAGVSQGLGTAPVQAPDAAPPGVSSLPAIPGPGDARLTDAQVLNWFDPNLPRGDGQRCEVRPGNDVRELIDGPATFASMADAIRTASRDVEDPEAVRPTLFVQRHFGLSPTDPIWVNSIGWLAEGADGCLYGTSPQGGKNMRGTVFKVTPDGKTLTILHDFDFPTGSGPLSGLTRAADGSFYGTTYEGGKYGVGTIFRISADGAYSDLWDFRNGTIVPPLPYPQQPTEQQKLDAAGSYPVAPPVVGKDGGLYGVTSYGNNQQYGVLYSGSLHGLYFFKGENGTLPMCLVAGTDGYLYGTTLKGNATCPLGTVFRATTGGAVTTLHRFEYATGSGSCAVMQASDGNLYGTTMGGGTLPVGLATGVLYRLTPAGEYTVIHTFTGHTDGGVPYAGVTEGKDGYLYGVNTWGGGGGRGVLYRVRPDGSRFTVLYSFLPNWSTGRHARTTLLRHSNGKFYGTTYQGGQFDKGVIYSLEPARFVCLLGWWVTDSLPLAAGDPSSTIRQLFSDASDKDVQVRAMLWDSAEKLAFQNSGEVSRINGLAGGAAILDDRTLDLGSHHQKILVVSGSRGLIAFCGGVDINPDRVEPNASGAPLHDVHCRIQGPAAADLLSIFVQRWNDHPQHTDRDKEKGALRAAGLAIPDPVPGANVWVQVGRTYGNGAAHAGIAGVRPWTKGYTFAPYGEQSAARMILRGIQKAEKFIYLEDQYFVDTAPNAKLGLDVRAALVAALQKPTFEHLTVLIPHPSISDLPQVTYRRQQLIAALRKAGGAKVRVFVRRPVGGPHSYVHAKVWIFDDKFAVIGSVNTNRRSWTHDSEVALGLCDQGDGTSLLLPHRLRMRLWREHLNLPDTPDGWAKVRDGGLAGANLWLTPEARATVWPYDEKVDPELVTTDTAWALEDPDGS